jgi:hypothetical protein
VNLWTWYWTSGSSWRTVDATATTDDGSVWATVTASPIGLTFDPGDGSSSVTCPGRGRPWTEKDGNKAPSDGGCGFRYAKVSDAVRARVSIRWQVAWVGSGDTGGSLPLMTTQTISPVFKVMQIQTENR